MTLRFVASLLPSNQAPRPAALLNPVFTIEGQPHVMVTQFAGAVRVSELDPCVGSLLPEDTAIVAALDMLIGA